MFDSKWYKHIVKLRYLIIFIIFFSSIQARAVDLLGDDLTITLESSYASKYLWMGYDVFSDDGGAFQPSVNFDWNGLFVGAMGSFADESGHQSQERLDYYGGYGRRWFEDDIYALDTLVSVTFYDGLHGGSSAGTRSTSDLLEMGFGMFMPKLIPLGSSYLIPSYSLFYESDEFRDDEARPDRGWLQKFDVSYNLPIPALIPEQENQFIQFDCNIMYNDGILDSDPSWSHTGMGINTTFEWNRFFFTPAVKYQYSFEDTVNPENEIYAVLSIGYSF